MHISRIMRKPPLCVSFMAIVAEKWERLNVFAGVSVKTLVLRLLLIFLNRHKMPIHIADMAEIQAIIREEETDGF